MLDFTKEETSQKTMTANVILTFDTVINEFGTQEIFDVEFTIADTGDETVFNMLSAINDYVDCHNLPKKDLRKISTDANWTKTANDHDLNIAIIDDTNGKWQFGWKESMTEDEKFLEDEFGFGQNVYFTIDYVQQSNERIFQQILELKKTKNDKYSAANATQNDLKDFDLQKTLETARENIDEQTVAHLFVNQWKTISRWTAIDQIKTMIGVSTDDFEPILERELMRVVDQVYQCRFELLAFIAENDNLFFKWLKYKDFNLGCTVKLSDLEFFRRIIVEPFDLIPDIEFAIEDYKDDLFYARQDLNFVLLEKLSQRVSSVHQILCPNTE